MKEDIIRISNETVDDCAKIKPVHHVFVQNFVEAQQLAEFVVGQNKGRDRIFYLEVGARLGGSFIFWGRVLKHYFNNVEGIAIDLPGAPHEGEHSQSLEYCVREIGLPIDECKLIIGDSHEPSTRGQVEDALRMWDLDFLFIDGDHSENGVLLDYEMYAPLVRKGGVIAFHDIVECKDWPWVEVWKAWPKIKGRNKGKQIKEFIVEGNKYGIGAIVK